MKTIFTILILLISLASRAATYYVSSSDGSDSANGTTTSTSWQTISKINAFNFADNDVVLLKCGDVWNETLTLSTKGSDTNHLTISSYGIGNKPEFRAYGDLSAGGYGITDGVWTLYTTGIYRTATTQGIGRIWMNGAEKKESIDMTLSDEYPWRYESGFIYVKAPSSPSTYFTSLQYAGRLAYGCYFVGALNIVFDGIKVSGGKWGSIMLYDCQNIEIRNCDIGNKVQGYGVYNTASANSKITDNVLIHDNVINSLDNLYYSYYRNDHSIPSYEGIGLTNGTKNTKVYNNYFYGWRHSGVGINALDSAYPCHDIEVYNNYITAPLIDYGRGVGFDFHTGGYNNSFHDNTIVNTTVRNQFNGNGLKVYNNVIDNVKGCPYPEKADVGQGISIEGYATPAINMEIYNNTITNCASDGIAVQSTFANGRYSNNIHDNNVFNNLGYQLLVQYNAATHDNTYANNHLVDPTPTAAVRIYGTASYSATSFNSLVTGYNDVISSNDAILKYGTYTSTVSDLMILYNETNSAKTVSLSQPMINASGIKYATSVTLQPYTSVVLMKNATLIKESVTYNKKVLVYHGKLLIN